MLGWNGESGVPNTQQLQSGLVDRFKWLCFTKTNNTDKEKFHMQGFPHHCNSPSRQARMGLICHQPIWLPSLWLVMLKIHSNRDTAIKIKNVSSGTSESLMNPSVYSSTNFRHIYMKKMYENWG